MFAPEVTNMLKQAMIVAVERNGGDYGTGCYLTEADVESIISTAARQEVAVVREEVLKWANSFRERHANPDHRAMFLRIEHTDDKRDIVYNCLIVCFCNKDIPTTGFVLNKTRGKGVYNITAQLAVRNTTTNETRIFLEKSAVRNSVLYKALAHELGATQIQVFSFPINDQRPAAFARRSAEEFALKPDMQVVRIGDFKTPYSRAPPAPAPAPKKPDAAVMAAPAPVSGPSDDNNAGLITTVKNLSSAVATHAQVDVTHAGAADTSAATIATLESDLAHQRSLVHKSNGALGARVRTENTETRRENKRMKVDIEERRKREQQAHEEKMMLLEQIRILMATNAQLVARIQ